MELEELHVLERQALAPDDADAVAGERVGVRCRLEHLPEAARREDDRLRVEDVQLAGRELVGDDAGRDAVGREREVERIELVVELDAELHAVLEQRLEDHVPGAVGGVAGPADRGLAVVASVAAEAPLVDLALGGAVEGQAHVLEVDDRVDGLLREDLRGVLVDEVVAALDRVVGVPLGVVLFDVREGGGHAALRGAGVGSGRVELRDDADPRLGPALGLGRGDRGAHARTTGPDDHDVVLVVVDAVLDGGLLVDFAHGFGVLN